MTKTKLSKLEYQIMDVLWSRGESSIREMQQSVPAKRTPAYTTIQTTVYRMEDKNIVRRVKKVGNFHVFAANVSRQEAQRDLIEDLLNLFGGRSQPIMAHLVDSGKLSLADVKEAERLLREIRKGKKK